MEPISQFEDRYRIDFSLIIMYVTTIPFFQRERNELKKTVSQLNLIIDQQGENLLHNDLYRKRVSFYYKEHFFFLVFWPIMQ